MKQVIQQRVTPQRKIIGVSKKFGNSGVKKQQGTTRVLYDSLPLDGSKEFRFFEESSNRNFPFSNTGADGNRLGVGETIAIERAYFSVVTMTAALDDILAIVPVGAVDANLVAGELSIEIANSQTMKKVALLSFDPRFNKSALHVDYNNFEFDTQLVISPLLEYMIRTRVNDYTPIIDTFLRLTIEGVGSILAPRVTM